MSGTLLYTGSEWDFQTLDRTFKAIEDIALKDLALDVYPNQIELISSEQMLDAYSSHAMPLMYHHWSFGKVFAREEQSYRKGWSGLAYEVVINSNPCIAYLMEENSMTMQALVMAHACFGHNHFFKNNYLFRQWTNADTILDYLSFAKKYVSACEERYGFEAVEQTLDSAHALMDQGVFRYQRPPRPTRVQADARRRRREAYQEESFNDLFFRTLPPREALAERSFADDDEDMPAKQAMKLPEENLIYFIEKYSPGLRGWQRECLRIVRNVAQYFYPQMQTKVMNEGCATFVHHYVMNRLYDLGQIPEGSILEFLHSHSNVVMQTGFDDGRYYGINPYALGFAMMADIKRISEAPSDEDRDWFPQIAGRGDWRDVLKDAWAQYRDDSFIQQYLSPKVIRDLKLFAIHDKAEEPTYSVSAIHNELGYRRVRNALARTYELAAHQPDIQVVEADLSGDRTLRLRHWRRRGVALHAATRDAVLRHVERLWGYPVILDERDA
ncbi:MAG TPA: SpoVR family protein [Alphaproteobacteria bacterium]|nr:SpoVR family protein [Alphaproteobacteria bacterium]